MIQKNDAALHESGISMDFTFAEQRQQREIVAYPVLPAASAEALRSAA
jgi:hypothetical protein